MQMSPKGIANLKALPVCPWLEQFEFDKIIVLYYNPKTK